MKQRITSVGIRHVHLFLILICLAPSAHAANSFSDQFAPVEIHGFIEMRAGCRMQNDSYEKNEIIVYFFIKNASSVILTRYFFINSFFVYIPSRIWHQQER